MRPLALEPVLRGCHLVALILADPPLLERVPVVEEVQQDGNE